MSSGINLLVINRHLTASSNIHCITLHSSATFNIRMRQPDRKFIFKKRQIRAICHNSFRQVTNRDNVYSKHRLKLNTKFNVGLLTRSLTKQVQLLTHGNCTILFELPRGNIATQKYSLRYLLLTLDRTLFLFWH